MDYLRTSVNSHQSDGLQRLLGVLRVCVLMLRWLKKIGGEAAREPTGGEKESGDRKCKNALLLLLLNSWFWGGVMEKSAYWSWQFLLTAAPVSDLWDVLRDHQKWSDCRAAFSPGVCVAPTSTHPNGLTPLGTRHHVSFFTNGGTTMKQHTEATHLVETARPHCESRCRGKRCSCLIDDETESEWRAVTPADVPHCNEIKEEISSGRPAAPTYLHHYCKLSNPFTSLFRIMPTCQLSSQSGYCRWWAILTFFWSVILIVPDFLYSVSSPRGSSISFFF